MNEKVDEVIERLRAWGDSDIEHGHNGRGEEMLQAADLLAAMKEEIAMLKERGARVVVAYNVAIACPKGVVPDDEFYDPLIAASAARDMERARKALNGTNPFAQPPHPAL